MWPVYSSHPTFGRVWYKKAVPPVYITYIYSPADTEEGLVRLVGSFPKARLVLGEVAENLYVRLRIVRLRTLPPVCMPAVYSRRLDDSVAVRLWVLSSGKWPYEGEP